MWLVSLALAAPGLELPPGEDPRLWSSAARLAGVEVGCEEGPCVYVAVTPTAWELRVGTRRGSIPPPVDERGRAAVAWLAASLARPLPELAVAAVPPPTPKSAAEVPKRRRTPIAAPAPTPESVASDQPSAPAPVRSSGAPTSTPDVPRQADNADASDLTPDPAQGPDLARFRSPPTERPAPVAPSPAAVVSAPRPWVDVRAAGGATLQPGITPGAVGGLGATIGLQRWSFEAGAEVSTASTFTALDPRWTQSRLDLVGTVGFVPVPWLGLGVGGGASRRAWSDAGALLAATWVPTVHAAIDARAPGRVLDVVVRLRPAVDLRGVAVVLDGEPIGRLPQVSLVASAGVIVHVRR